MTLKSDMNTILSEVSDVVTMIDETSVQKACELICNAKNVMLYGCGREGLQMQGLAMRLHHLGKPTSMQGDMAAPPMTAGDLFIVSAGPGHLSTVQALAGQAKAGGAKILFLTGVADAHLTQTADHTLLIPAQTMANDDAPKVSVTPMGSLYEVGMCVLFEAMILQLIPMMGQTADTIRARHTNME